MLKITQCQNPLPVGASGSKAVTAKLLVPAGAPDQLSAGDTFLPVQPKLLNTKVSAIFAPSEISGLFSSNAGAAVEASVAANIPAICTFSMSSSPGGR